MLREMITLPPNIIISKSDPNVCFWHKADIAEHSTDVRFWGNSGHRIDEPQCPLMTQSGHERFKIAALQTDL